ncbi:hypothetical protein UFOVP423_13 [uncultured Caudovirales phage]|uniref:Uncharacterized protein n=1 Tax=uncultured Caudovirales phage TaxID=2100421 RepID=A0A6J5MDY9_9CAUD|nr:hypothetical protein UFOVP423_13 [uncultured Caudovirales phage]
MPRAKFDITIDGDQWRQKRDRIGFSAGGDTFNTGEYFSDTWIDPLTDTLFLRPRCYYVNWYTSNTAPYDKLSLADFGLSSPWKETDITGIGGSRYLEGTPASSGVAVQTTSSYAKNTGFYVGFFAYSEGSNYIAMECGYSNTPGVANDTALRIYSDGVCEVWRGGKKVTEGKLSGTNGSSKLENNLFEFIILPCRHKELLVLSTKGNGVRAIFEDILDTDPSPTITPASRFWIKMYGTVKFQAAPLKFATSGYASSFVYDLASPPPVGATLEPTNNPAWASGSGTVYGDISYRTGNSDAVAVSLVREDGTTAFVPNGVLNELRIKATLSGNGSSSPAVYGVAGGYERERAFTDDSEVANLGNSWQKISYQVPETGGSSFTFDLFNPSQAGITGLYDHSNKPVLVYLGDTIVHEGMTEPIEFQYSTTTASDKAILKSNAHITELLKSYQFRERMIFDNMLISHATDDCIIRRLVHLVGGTDYDLNLQTASVRAGDKAPATCGDFIEIADIGENAWSYLSKVMQDYLGGWWYGEYPVLDTGAPNTFIKFTTKSQSSINGSASKYTWYETTADAIAAGKPTDEAWRYVYREQRYHYIAPEGNEVIVTGYDNRLGLPVQAVKKDLASIDPTTPPSTRPANWLGVVKSIGLTNRAIVTQDLADSACTLLFDRCSVAREVREIEVELPVNDTTGFPIWVSDKVTLDGLGDYIVTSISGEVIKDPETFLQSQPGENWIWRPATIILSNITGYSDATSFEDIVNLSTINGVRNFIARRGFIEGSVTRLPLYQRNNL